MASLQRQGGSATTIGLKFCCERLFRLLPALIVAVLICFEVMIAVGYEPTTEQLIKNLILYDNPINGATWTLNAEAIGTFFILAGYFAYRRLGLSGLLLVLVLVVTAGRHLPPKDLFYFFRWSALPFAIGMLIPTRAGRDLLLAIPVWLIWIAALVAVFGRHITDAHGSTTENVSIACAGLVVAALFYNKAGELGRILATRPLVFLGTISYSLYLFNVVFVIVATKLIGTRPTLFGAISEGLIIIALTIPIALASYHWIERPMINLGRRLLGWRSSGSQ